MLEIDTIKSEQSKIPVQIRLFVKAKVSTKFDVFQSIILIL